MRRFDGTLVHVKNDICVQAFCVLTRMRSALVSSDRDLSGYSGRRGLSGRPTGRISYLGI